MISSEFQYSTRPTLIVGLGGTGVNTIRTLKKMLGPLFGGKIPKHIRFLGIDTSDQLPNGEDTLDDGSEFIYTYVDNPRVFVSHNIHDTILKWWPGSLPRSNAISHGSSQIRARGRLAFYVNIKRIQEKIEEEISLITSVEQNENPYLRAEARSKCDVYIIASLCGGTGSGMFLDVALLVKHFLRESQGQVKGMFLLPSVFRGKGGTKFVIPNAYASLVELDHLMQIAEKRDFTIRYSDDLVVNLRSEPFNHIYLIDNQNEQHFRLKEISEIVDLMANLIKVQMLDFGEIDAQSHDNLNTEFQTQSVSGKKAYYASLGLCQIKPRLEDRGESNRSSIEKLLKQFTQSTPDGTWNHGTGNWNKFIQEAGIDFNRLAEELLEECNKRLDRKMISVGPTSNPRELPNLVKTAIEHGELTQSIEKLTQVKKSENAITTVVNTLMKEVRFGELRSFLHQLTKEIAGLLTKEMSLDQLTSGLTDWNNILIEEQLNTNRTPIRAWWDRNIRGVADDELESDFELDEEELKEKVNQEIRKQVRQLISFHIKEYYQKLRNFVDNLEIDRQIFEDKLNRVYQLSQQSSAEEIYGNGQEQESTLVVYLPYERQIDIVAEQFGQRHNLSLDWGKKDDKEILHFVADYVDRVVEKEGEKRNPPLSTGSNGALSPTLTEVINQFKTPAQESRLKRYFNKAAKFSSPYWIFDRSIIPTNKIESKLSYLGTHSEVRRVMNGFVPSNGNRLFELVEIAGKRELIFMQKSIGVPLFALREIRDRWLRLYWEQSYVVESHCWENPWEIKGLFPTVEDEYYAEVWRMIAQLQAGKKMHILKDLETRIVIDEGMEEGNLIDLHLKLCYPSRAYKHWLEGETNTLKLTKANWENYVKTLNGVIQDGKNHPTPMRRFYVTLVEIANSYIS